MAVADVAGQNTGTQAYQSTPLSKTYPGSVTAGNLLICGVVTGPTGGGNAQVGTVADSQDSYATNWTQAINSNIAGNNMNNAIFWRIALSSAACTVKYTPPAAQYIALAINEYSGNDGTSPIGNTSSATNGTGTTPATGNMVVSSSGCIVVGVLNLSGARTITLGSGFSDVYQDQTVEVIDTEDQAVNAGTYTANWTISSSATWVCVGAILLPPQIQFQWSPTIQTPDPIFTKEIIGY